MADERAQWLSDLKRFLRTIQKPNRPLESVGEHERLVASGLVDSLAIMQIVVHLEETYGIDFAASGFDPDRLATMGSIVDLIAESRG